MPRLDSYLTNKEKQNQKDYFDVGRIYMAEVMDTRNVARAGEIKVWVLGSNFEKKDSSKWLTASYASPFYGTYENQNEIFYEKGVEKKGDEECTSFGMWFPMPYVGNYVFIFYPNITGENVLPYWFACPMRQEANSMLPGIPKQFFNDEAVAVKENTLDKVNRGDSLSKYESTRREYKPLTQAIEQQGLSKDKLRGYSTASSKREAPSHVYGFLTPLGNSFTMDDGWSQYDRKENWNIKDVQNVDLKGSDNKTAQQRDEIRKDAGFRLRTRNGTQLLISDNGNIYMINKDGTAWAEITDDGRLQGYAQTSADIACDGDINIKSKRKIIMEADEGFALKSSKGMSIELGGDIQLSTPHVQSNAIINTHSINAKEGNIESFQSQMVQANGVFSGTLQGTAMYATNAGIVPIEQPKPNIVDVQFPDVLVEPLKVIAGQNGGTQTGINTFAPTHEPYDGHDKNYIYPKLDINPTVLPEVIPFTSPYVTRQLEPITPVPVDTTKDETLPKQDISEHFTLADLCYSDTAVKNNITNIPSVEEQGKLQALAVNVLDKVWNHYGQKVTVNSGYRGATLNSLIGGAISSQHCKGEAADIEIYGVNNYELACWIRDNLDFDQLILEYATNLTSDPNSGWVHVSYKESGNRKQCLTINKYGTKTGLIY